MKQLCMVLLIAGAVVFGGCNKDGGDGALKSLDAAAYLARIPADTPFAMVSLTPMPRSFTDGIGESMAPLADMLQARMAELKQETTDPLGKALLAELDGKLSRKGMESLGVSLEPRMALYAIGFSLAFRLDLANGKPLEEAIGRVEQASGKALAKAQLGGVSYREYVNEQEGIAIAIAILGNELVVGAMHKNARDKVLPVLFGTAKPEKSLAESKMLDKLVSDYALSGVWLGFIDVQALWRLVSGEASALTRETMAASGVVLPPLSDVCKSELSALVGTVPRVVFGYQEITDKTTRSIVAVELTGTLGAELSDLGAGGFDLAKLSEGQPLFMLGMNADMAKVLAWARKKAAAMAASPYQCEHLAELDQAVEEMVRDLNEPLPPHVEGIKGMVMVVSDFQMAGIMPSGSGYGAIVLDNAVQVAELAKAEIPQLSGITVKAGDEPISVPLGLPGLPSVEILLREKEIGLAAGAGALDKLKALLGSKASDGGPAMVLGYDYGKIMQLTTQGLATGNASAQDLGIVTSLSKLFGYTSMEIYFDKDKIRMVQRSRTR